MPILQFLASSWHWVAGLATLALAVITSFHAVLYKRDVRATVAWIGLIWLVPLLGSALYWLLGVNRIRRRAALLRGQQARFAASAGETTTSPEELAALLPPGAGHLSALARLSEAIVRRPLLGGNRFEPLLNGDEAYPAMIAAIGAAKQTISLATYIFDNDAAGRRFAAALGEAVRRGVEVRVLVDAAGLRYSRPSIQADLERQGIRFARFLPAYDLSHLTALDLRNHRKLLVVDGRLGFTGGMNIRAGHELGLKPAHPVQDTHFRIEGPVVAHLQEAFVDDWLFTTREELRGERWFPTLTPSGTGIARGVSDGPDEDFEKLQWVLLGAIACARTSVRVVTPYFLPEETLLAGLCTAALRGVQVDVVMPGENNLPYVQWASEAEWTRLVERGCRLWLTRPPFDHSKLVIVDGCWSMIGSANWDPRSLRLNFEFNVECFDAKLAAALNQIVDRKLEGARPVTRVELSERGLGARLRSGLARLLTPYI